MYFYKNWNALSYDRVLGFHKLKASADLQIECDLKTEIRCMRG